MEFRVKTAGLWTGTVKKQKNRPSEIPWPYANSGKRLKVTVAKSKNLDFLMTVGNLYFYAHNQVAQCAIPKRRSLPIASG